VDTKPKGDTTATLSDCAFTLIRDVVTRSTKSPSVCMRGTPGSRRRKWWAQATTFI